jgi:hypothetical protein
MTLTNIFKALAIYAFLSLTILLVATSVFCVYVIPSISYNVNPTNKLMFSEVMSVDTSSHYITVKVRLFSLRDAYYEYKIYEQRVTQLIDDVIGGHTIDLSKYRYGGGSIYESLRSPNTEKICEFVFYSSIYQNEINNIITRHNGTAVWLNEYDKCDHACCTYGENDYSIHQENFMLIGLIIWGANVVGLCFIYSSLKIFHDYHHYHNESNIDNVQNKHDTNIELSNIISEHDVNNINSVHDDSHIYNTDDHVKHINANKLNNTLDKSYIDRVKYINENNLNDTPDNSNICNTNDHVKYNNLNVIYVDTAYDTKHNNLITQDPMILGTTLPLLDLDTN